ncbi:MAG TPA: hypothetical protein VN843_18010, partial [Anaerolineales bacterium]|nr:hypothetical protein [Anaerolineales bacterium]
EPDHGPPTEPPASEFNARSSIDELRRYLGENVFEWLCACSVYTELHWDLTLYLGSLVSEDESLHREQNLLRLVNLPWFRSGSIPDELRLLLIRELKPKKQETIRKAIIELLEKSPAPPGTFAAHDRRLDVVIQRSWLNRNQPRELKRILKKEGAGFEVSDFERDFTLIRFLESAPISPLALRLPRGLQHLFYYQGIPAFGSRTAVRVLTTVIMMVAIWFSFLVFLPRSSNAPSRLVNSSGPAELRFALDSITANDILQHTKVLSANEFEGRGPGTKGEELTVKYLTEQYQRMGLKPGNPDGTYVQKVPLVGFTGEPTASFTVGDTQLNLSFPEDYVAVSRRFVPESRVENSDMVFVGYGVVAPEYGWDDYKGLDVRGKTIVMLINDPQVPDSADPTKLDDKMFRGKAMTYYGRWTYKYEIAAQKGAAAAVIIHETGPAGYPYEVVSGSWSRENFDIQTPDKNMKRAAVESW